MLQVDECGGLTGDDKVPGYLPTEPGTPVDGHSFDDILDYVETKFDPGTAAEIRAEVDKGCVNLVHVRLVDGRSDATTVAVNTRFIPLWACAMILLHEWEHHKRARVAALPTLDPDGGDPLTSDANPCGRCNHALMALADIMNANALCLAEISEAEKADICETFKAWRMSIGKKLTQCKYDGGIPCLPGFSTFPNIDEFIGPDPLPNCGC